MATKSSSSDIFDERYPVRRVLDLIGDKWTPVALFCLSGGVRRFNELQHHIPDISKKMLIQALGRLQADGLVERKVCPNEIHDSGPVYHAEPRRRSGIPKRVFRGLLLF